MKSLLRQLFATKKPAIGRPAARTRLQVESLERREVPSAATASVSIYNGILDIQGGAGDNDVKVQLVMANMGGHYTQGYDVSQHGQSTGLYVPSAYSFLPGYFNEIDFHGFAKGNQSFDNDTALTAQAWGGRNARNVFIAGSGENYFTGGQASDVYIQAFEGSYMDLTFQAGSHETVYNSGGKFDLNCATYSGKWAPASLDIWIPATGHATIAPSIAGITSVSVTHSFNAISVTNTQPPPSNQDSSVDTLNLGSIFVNDGF